MATITTTTAAKAWRPDIFTFDPEKELKESLYLSATTFSGTIEGDAPSVRVAFVNDADSAQFTAEGAEIPEDDVALSEVQVFTGKLTRLVKISEEQYKQLLTADRLATSLQRDIVKAADRALLVQAAPTGGAVAPAAGLYNTAGIVNAGEVDANLDVLVDAIAELQSNDATPSLLVVDPIASARLAKLKDSTTSNRALLSPDATASGASSVQGLKWIVNNALSAGTGLILDPSAIASAYGKLIVATSFETYFTSDNVAVKATWRIGHNLVHPDRIAKFTVADPDA